MQCVDSKFQKSEHFKTDKIDNGWAVGVVQLAEWSFSIPEDPSSNPVIGNFYRTLFYCNGPFKKDLQEFIGKNSVCNQVDSSSNLDSNKELDFYIKILLSVLFHSVFKKTIQFCMKYINANFIKKWLRPFD